MKGKGSQQMCHGRIRIFNGPRPCIIEINYALQDEPLIKNVGCFWAYRLSLRTDCSARYVM